jgi:hypothetical protein
MSLERRLVRVERRVGTVGVRTGPYPPKIVSEQWVAESLAVCAELTQEHPAHALVRFQEAIEPGDDE